MTKFFSFLFTFSVFATSSFAQSFYVKNKDGSLATMNFEFSVDSTDRSIQFKTAEKLSYFSNDAKSIKTGKIFRREPSDAEKIADAAVTILTSLLILSTHDTYDISSDLRLSRMMGAVFFILPIEANDIYRKCGDQQYLVAVSEKPDGESLKQLKSMDEIRKLCDHKSSGPNS